MGILSSISITEFLLLKFLYKHIHNILVIEKLVKSHILVSKMKLTILRIENRIVNSQLDDGIIYLLSDDVPTSEFHQDTDTVAGTRRACRGECGNSRPCGGHGKRPAYGAQ